MKILEKDGRSKKPMKQISVFRKPSTEENETRRQKDIRYTRIAY